MLGSSQSSESTDINPKINIDFKENSPFQEDVISEIYQRPDRSFFPRTSKVGKFNQYRQSGTEVFAKTG